MIVLFVATIIACGAWARMFKNFSDESVFSPFFWYLSFHSWVFLLRPILLLSSSGGGLWEYMELMPNEDALNMTVLVSTLGLLTFWLGYEYARRRPSITGGPEIGVPSKYALLVTWLILGSVAVYSVMFVGQSAANDNINIEMDRIGGVAINVNQNGYILDAQFMLLGLCALLALRFNFRFLSLLPCVAFLVYRSYIGWGRWSIVLVALALYLLWLRCQGRRWPSAGFILALFPIALLFSTLGEDRDYFKKMLRGEVSEYAVSTSSVLDSFVQGMDFANFEYLTYVISHVPQSTGAYSFGLQHLQLFTEPVPRILWKGKPAGAPIPFFNLNDYGNFNGLTVSVVGDGWISAGWFGVTVTLTGLGYMLGLLYNRFLASGGNIRFQLCYIVFAAMYLQIFRDGSLVGAAKIALFGIMPVIFCYWIDRVIGIGDSAVDGEQQSLQNLSVK